MRAEIGAGEVVIPREEEIVEANPPEEEEVVEAVAVILVGRGVRGWGKTGSVFTPAQ